MTERGPGGLWIAVGTATDERDDLSQELSALRRSSGTGKGQGEFGQGDGQGSGPAMQNGRGGGSLGGTEKRWYCLELVELLVEFHLFSGSVLKVLYIVA